MKIIVGKESGFCFGVKRAVDGVKEDVKNLDKYIHLPNYILEKYKQGIITKPHFSDIIWIELLIKYGGTWVDASIS